MNNIVSRVNAYRGTSPLLGKAFIGASGVFALLAAYNYMSSHNAQSEIEFRKSQLSLPVYRLSDEEMINPPWNR